MSEQGLDKDRAPSAAMAKKMLDHIGGRWWNVYIGGPTSLGVDWTPERVRDYAKHGIDRFMLTYAGRQHGGPLTRAQGRADGLEAVRIAKGFGYSGHFPVCLDVELRTFESAPSKTVEYVRAWCAAVRGAGVRPGVYANPGPLAAMARGNVDADFVWVASWINHGPAPHDPHDIPRFPRELWSRRGARAWQYAGAYDNKPCQVLGVDVDINVADLGCLVGPPGQVHARPPRPTRLIRRGDRGDRVERVTNRLARLRSRRTGAPYLDGPRRRFDRGAEQALRAFQREHGLDVDGVYGPASGRALAAALKRQRRRRPGDKAGTPGGGSNGAASGGKDGAGKVVHGEAPKERPTLRALIEDVRRQDAETNAAWERLVAYGERRQVRLERLQDPGDEALLRIAKTLEEMQDSLETLVEVERRELALDEAEAAEEAAEKAAEATVEAASAQPAPAGAAPAPAGPPAPAAGTPAAAGQPAPADSAPAAGTPATTEAAATLTPGAVRPNGDGSAAAAALAPAREPLVLDELSDEELQERVERLGRATDRSRLALMRRYIATERQLRVLEPPEREPRERVRERERPRDVEAPRDVQAPREAPRRRRRRRRPKDGAPVRRPQEHIRDLQERMNRFTQKYLVGVGPLIADGKRGPLTNKRIQRVKFYLGYKRAQGRLVTADPDFLRQMEHPRSPRASNPAMVARGGARRRKQHKAARASSRSRAGVVTFDGKKIAAWMRPHVEWARANGWQGVVLSGYRTPEESEQICREKCGHPKCPGTCGGKDSNHSGRIAPAGALDVTDYVRFRELMKRCPHQPSIKNALPSDVNHFSHAGN